MRINSSINTYYIPKIRKVEKVSSVNSNKSKQEKLNLKIKKDKNNATLSMSTLRYG